MQELIVGLIVVWAIFAVAWRYAPRSAKQKPAAALSRLYARLGWNDLAQRTARQAATGCGSGCGTCGGCDGKSESPQTPRKTITLKMPHRTTHH